MGEGGHLSSLSRIVGSFNRLGCILVCDQDVASPRPSNFFSKKVGNAEIFLNQGHKQRIITLFETILWKFLRSSNFQRIVLNTIPIESTS